VMTSHDLVINLFDLVVEILAQAENEDVAWILGPQSITKVLHIPTTSTWKKWKTKLHILTHSQLFEGLKCESK
jgi:hypothetical protein